MSGASAPVRRPPIVREGVEFFSGDKDMQMVRQGLKALDEETPDSPGFLRNKNAADGQGAKKPPAHQRPEKTWVLDDACGRELSRPKRVSWPFRRNSVECEKRQ